MLQFTNLTGLASVASAMTAAVLLLPGVARLPKLILAAVLVAVFVLVMIPFGAMPIAAYVRGATGDLSITTLVLLGCALLSKWCKSNPTTVRAGHVEALLILIALTAVIFYPLALGIGPFDAYRMGYGEPLFVAALLLFAVIAWFRKSYLIVLCLALAALAWSFGWYESDNLWDYLLDPFVAIYALRVVAIKTTKWVIKHYA